MPYKDLEKRRANHQARRKKLREAGDSYYQRHPERRQRKPLTPDERCEKNERQRKRRAEGSANYQLIRREIIRLLGDKCCRCGFSDLRALQIDHVNGGGHRARSGLNYRTAMYDLVRALRAGQPTPDYQLLCANCNWIKRYENPLEKGGYPLE